MPGVGATAGPHAPDTGARLSLAAVDAAEVLELFAFAPPATFCLPTIRGMAAVLALDVPATPEDEVRVLPLTAAVTDT